MPQLLTPAVMGSSRWLIRNGAGRIPEKNAEIWLPTAQLDTAFTYLTDESQVQRFHGRRSRNVLFLPFLPRLRSISLMRDDRYLRASFAVKEFIPGLNAAAANAGITSEAFVSAAVEAGVREEKAMNLFRVWEDAKELGRLRVGRELRDASSNEGIGIIVGDGFIAKGSNGHHRLGLAWAMGFEHVPVRVDLVDIRAIRTGYWDSIATNSREISQSIAVEP